MPAGLLGEMTKAAEDHYISLNEDQCPSSATSGEPVLLCPDTSYKILHIVSNVRQNRMDILCDYQVESARSYVAAQSEDVLIKKVLCSPRFLLLQEICSLGKGR